MVRAITDVVRTIRNARPAVRNLVLLGNDTALPFARLDDLTTIANEADYASTFARSDDLYGALFEHRVLSDDPYATTDPIPYLQRQLFVPQLAVGRLVETAAQITGTLDRFLSFGGDLDPTSARTSGYDFLQDGADGVAAAFAGIVGAQQPATTPPLIGDLWTTNTLAGALGTNTGLFGMNGHADHHRLQPAAGAQPLLRRQPPGLAGALGRVQHGLPLRAVRERRLRGGPSQPTGRRPTPARARPHTPATSATATATPSRSRTRRRSTSGSRRACATACRSARRSSRPSRATSPALGLVGVYDEKAMSELALYGLPMWSLAGATPPPHPTPALPSGVTQLSTDPDPVTGLLVDRYRSQPSTTERTRL